MAAETDISWWGNAMTTGLRANVGLLATILPRVSPEYVVIAASAQGLVAASNDVELERARKDLVVRKDRTEYWFELKALWGNGLAECISGLRADLGKIGSVQNAYAVAFAYSLEKCPPHCEARLTKIGLADTVAEAVRKLGAPAFVGELISIDWHGTVGSARLVAWASQQA